MASSWHCSSSGRAGATSHGLRTACGRNQTLSVEWTRSLVESFGLRTGLSWLPTRSHNTPAASEPVRPRRRVFKVPLDVDVVDRQLAGVVVRREVARRGGARPSLRIARNLFTALPDRAGVIAHRSRALERVRFLLTDRDHAAGCLTDVETRMI